MESCEREPSIVSYLVGYPVSEDVVVGDVVGVVGGAELSEPARFARTRRVPPIGFARDVGGNGVTEGDAVAGMWDETPVGAVLDDHPFYKSATGTVTDMVPMDRIVT